MWFLMWLFPEEPPGTGSRLCPVGLGVLGAGAPQRWARTFLSQDAGVMCSLHSPWPGSGVAGGRQPGSKVDGMDPAPRERNLEDLSRASGEWPEAVGLRPGGWGAKGLQQMLEGRRDTDEGKF